MFINKSTTTMPLIESRIETVTNQFIERICKYSFNTLCKQRGIPLDISFHFRKTLLRDDLFDEYMTGLLTDDYIGLCRIRCHFKPNAKTDIFAICREEEHCQQMTCSQHDTDQEEIWFCLIADHNQDDIVFSFDYCECDPNDIVLTSSYVGKTLAEIPVILENTILNQEKDYYESCKQ